jgi:hypothetical protein
MAKPKPKAKKKAKSVAKKATRKDVSDGASKMGDNIGAITKASVPAMKALLALQERMESDLGGYRSEFDELYEKHSKAIGCKKSILVGEFKVILANKRRMEKEAEMAQADRDQVEAIRASFDGTLFENFSGGELAEMSKAAAKAATAEEKAAAAEAADAARDAGEKQEDEA